LSYFDLNKILMNFEQNEPRIGRLHYQGVKISIDVFSDKIKVNLNQAELSFKQE